MVVMKHFIGLLLWIHNKLFWRSQSQSFKNRGVAAFVFWLHSPARDLVRYHVTAVRLVQSNYNTVGRGGLFYGEMYEKQNLCKTDTLGPADGCAKTDRCFLKFIWQLTILLMAPHIAYIFDVSVIRPVCGSTSAILIWIEAWSLAWIIRLLAELKHNHPREIWGSHSSDYEDNERNVFCDMTHNSHLPHDSTPHPTRQLLARHSLCYSTHYHMGPPTLNYATKESWFQWICIKQNFFSH
jgi:hypothetical protein